MYIRCFISVFLFCQHHDVFSKLKCDYKSNIRQWAIIGGHHQAYCVFAHVFDPNITTSSAVIVNDLYCAQRRYNPQCHLECKIVQNRNMLKDMFSVHGMMWNECIDIEKIECHLVV